MLSKNTFILAIFFAFPAWGVAQILQSDRLEIRLFNDNPGFEVINAYQDGVFLTQRILSLNGEELDLISLDTTFKERWHGRLPVDRKFLLAGKKVEKNSLYLLFRFQDLSKTDFELFIINQQSGTYTKHIIKNFIPFAPNDFHVTEKAVLIGGYFRNVPVVIYYSLITQTTKILPGLFNESGELIQVHTDIDGSIDVLIGAQNVKGQKTIWVKNYDADGDLIRNQALAPEENKNLLFARSIKTTTQLQLIAGVYGGRQADYGRGLFIASLDESGMQNIRYYAFADLENFFKYMRVKHEQRIKSRVERRKIKGKKTRFNYRVLVHEIVPNNNQFILLGEAFEIQYTYNNYYPGSYMGRSTGIFDGYRYTHAVAMGFTNQGDLIWDNSFEINDVKTFTLEQFVKLEIQEDKIALLYLFKNKLRTKIIKDNQVIEGKTSESIKTNNANDVVKESETNVTRLEYWYTDYFYAYGIQEISNPTLGKRRVFFINKVSYK